MPNTPGSSSKFKVSLFMCISPDSSLISKDYKYPFFCFAIICTVNLYHRITEWLTMEGTFWRSCGPTTLLNQGHLETVSQDHVQMAFEYLQGWRTHSLRRRLCQWSVTLTVKKCFLTLTKNLLCFDFCQLPMVLPLGTTEKNLAPSSLHLHFRNLYTLLRSPLGLLSSRLNSPSSLSLSS